MKIVIIQRTPNGASWYQVVHKLVIMAPIFLVPLLFTATLASHAEYRTDDGGYQAVNESAGDMVYAKQARSFLSFPSLMLRSPMADIAPRLHPTALLRRLAAYA